MKLHRIKLWQTYLIRFSQFVREARIQGAGISITWKHQGFLLFHSNNIIQENAFFLVWKARKCLSKLVKIHGTIIDKQKRWCGPFEIHILVYVALHFINIPNSQNLSPTWVNFTIVSLFALYFAFWYCLCWTYLFWSP